MTLHSNNSNNSNKDHRSRREWRASLEVRPRPKGAASKRAVWKGVSAFAAVGVLLSTYLLPAYADVDPAAARTTASSSVTTPQSPGAQSLVVPDELTQEPSPRGQYVVTRTTLAGYQPYEHLANTFVNNPNSVVQWPFAVGVPISSGFGYRSCRGCSSDHQGLDLNPGEGTPIEAIAAGVVTEIGNPDGSFGVYATIDHVIDGQNVSSVYAHMLQGSLALAVGDTVEKGQLVGQVGSTGQSTGAHLHLGIYLNGVTAIDPYTWLKAKVGS